MPIFWDGIAHWRRKRDEKSLRAFRSGRFMMILGACYQSESREYPHPRSKEELVSLARYRGSQAAMEYAEGFMLLREYLEIR